MKSRVLPSKELKLLAKQISAEKYKHDVRAQWLLLLAVQRSLNLGKTRLDRVLTELGEVTSEFEQDLDDDVADEMLLKAINAIGYDMADLYGGA